MADSKSKAQYGLLEREFSKIMHGKSADSALVFSILNKNNESHRAITDAYVGHWTDKDGNATATEEARTKRKGEYMNIVNNYYDLATDLYEEAWAQSFHFCRFAKHETFLQALARHEHYIAHRLEIKEGMTVLDVGCGVGRPAREIACFTGCKVVGLNNNSYQIQRATAYAKKEKLDHQVSFVQGDFMNIDLPANSFDCVYAIEATVHAPSLQDVYEQIYRVLKPGGKFGVFEWVMTDKYDDTKSEHRAIRLGIERGNGIASMMPRQHAIDSIKAAGFELDFSEDLALRPDPIPWWYPIAGEWKYVHTLWDLLGVIRMTKLGRGAVSSLLWGLECLRLAPSGTSQTANELSGAADNLVAGAKQGLFTPMFLMIARKPETASS